MSTPRRKPGYQTATIVSDKRETRDTRTLRLVPSEPFDWKTVQFIMVSAEIEGTVVSRAYSIASSPTKKDYLEITIKQTETPTMSKYLNEIPVGSTLQIKGPHGNFIWDETVSDKFFGIAAGSGITPFRAFMQYVIDKKLNVKFEVLYSSRYGDDVIYEQELRELIKQIPGGKYELSITRDTHGLDYARIGRINQEYLAEEIKGFEDGYFYLCGAPGFISSMIDDLTNLGIPRDHIKREQWS